MVVVNPTATCCACAKMEETWTQPASINAWYYDDNGDLPCTKHQYNPNRPVSQDHLASLGVLTWTVLETGGFEDNEFLNHIKVARGCNFEEVLTVSPTTLPNFEENLKKYFREHLQDHEETRYIIDGVGYEDVRDLDGQWIRIEIKKGVLIVLPPGMYHRFTLDENLYLKASLLYQSTPNRIQFEKSLDTDDMQCRREYLRSLLDAEAIAAVNILGSLRDGEAIAAENILDPAGLALLEAASLNPLDTTGLALLEAAGLSSLDADGLALLEFAGLNSLDADGLALLEAATLVDVLTELSLRVQGLEGASDIFTC